MNKINEYYQILGLKKDASLVEVKKAYRNLAKKYHPDNFINDNNLQKKAEEEIKKINVAYEAIKEYLTVENKEKLGAFSVTKTIPEFLYQQGVLAAEEGNLQEAIDYFSQAIELDKSYLEAYQYRGFLREKLGFINASQADFKIANELKIIQDIKVKNEIKNQEKKEDKTEKTEHKWQCIYTFRGHNKGVNCLTLTSYNNLLISGSKDNTIRLWRINTGKEIGVLDAHSAPINSLFINSKGTILISASDDKKIKIWNLASNKLINTLGGWFSGHKKSVLSVIMSPNEQYIISGSEDKTVKIWEAKTGKEIKTLIGYSAPILSLDISSNGELFASGGLEPIIRIRQTQNGKIVRSIKGNCGVLSVNFSPDNKILATGGFDRKIRLFDVNNGQEIKIFSGHKDRVSTVNFSPDGKFLVSGSFDHSWKLWDVETGELRESITPHLNHILAVQFSLDGNNIITASADCNIKVFSQNKPEKIRQNFNDKQNIDSFLSNYLLQTKATIKITKEVNSNQKLKELASELLELVNYEQEKANSIIRKLFFENPNKSSSWYLEKAIEYCLKNK